MAVAGAFAAVLPDLDVIAFRLGIPYADDFGHRGASHSLLFAACVGVVGAWFARRLHGRRGPAFLWLTACGMSHPLLDALTNGGLGVALLWPWQDTRFFAPWRPILVSPIGSDFLSARGLAVLWSEARWVGLPALALAACITVFRNGLRTRASLS